MTEKKLFAAAHALPEPEGRFEDVILRSHKTTPVKPKRRVRPVLVAVVLILLLTGGAVAHRYGQIQRSMWVVERYSTYVFPTANAWDRSQKLLEPYDLNLPESLMGYDFESGIRYSVVPRGTSQVEAFFTDFYNPVCFTYSILRPNPDGCNTDRLSFVDVIFGSTENDYWHHYFSTDEAGVWQIPDDTVPGTYRTEEYRGFQLHALTREVWDSTTEQYFPIHVVRWVDESRRTCFDVSIGWTEDLNFLLDFAKALIDMNE